MFIPSLIKSIQHISFTHPGGANAATQAITTVDPNYSIARLIGNGIIGDNSGSASGDFATVELTSGVLLTITVGDFTFLNGLNLTIEVIEYYPGFMRQAVQRGTLNIAGAATITDQLITAVGSKASVESGGWRSDLNSGSGTIREAMPVLRYLDATHVRGQRFNNGVVNTTTVAWQIVDWR